MRGWSALRLLTPRASLVSMQSVCSWRPPPPAYIPCLARGSPAALPALPIRSLGCRCPELRRDDSSVQHSILFSRRRQRHPSSTCVLARSHTATAEAVAQPAAQDGASTGTQTAGKLNRTVSMDRAGILERRSNNDSKAARRRRVAGAAALQHTDAAEGGVSPAARTGQRG